MEVLAVLAVLAGLRLAAQQTPRAMMAMMEPQTDTAERQWVDLLQLSEQLALRRAAVEVVED